MIKTTRVSMDVNLTKTVEVEVDICEEVDVDVEVTIELQDVLDYISDCSLSDEHKIIEALDIHDTYHELHEHLNVNTLDDEFKLTLLAKLYKESSNFVELERMLSEEAKSKIQYTVL